MLDAESGPEPDHIVIGGPSRYDRLTFLVDTIATTPVLWRSAESHRADRTSGTLNAYQLLVRVGPPSATPGWPSCSDEFGAPMDERNGGSIRP